MSPSAREPRGTAAVSIRTSGWLLGLIQVEAFTTADFAAAVRLITYGPELLHRSADDAQLAPPVQKSQAPPKAKPKARPRRHPKLVKSQARGDQPRRRFASWDD